MVKRNITPVRIEGSALPLRDVQRSLWPAGASLIPTRTTLPALRSPRQTPQRTSQAETLKGTDMATLAGAESTNHQNIARQRRHGTGRCREHGRSRMALSMRIAKRVFDGTTRATVPNCVESENDANQHDFKVSCKSRATFGHGVNQEDQFQLQT